MSIKLRIEDAEHLWHYGRKESAWILILIAADATARKRYPNEGNKVRFKSFIKDESNLIMTGQSQGDPKPVKIEFYSKVRGDGMSLADLFYIYLRCTLIHEAKMPNNISFTESKIEGEKIVGTLIVGNSDTPYQIPDHLVFNLMKAVKEAAENRDEFIGK